MCVDRTVLTFFACDGDEDEGAKAQEGEYDDELDEGTAFIAETEAAQVDEGDAGPAVERLISRIFPLPSTCVYLL